MERARYQILVKGALEKSGVNIERSPQNPVTARARGNPLIKILSREPTVVQVHEYNVIMRILEDQFPQQAKLNISAESETVLTPRKMDIVELMVLGMSNKEIAEALNLAEVTIRCHVTEIVKSLSVQNRTGVVNKVLREKILYFDE